VLELRLMHLFADDPAQPLVADRAEDVIDVLLFALAHQLFTAEAGIGVQDDLYSRPALTQLSYDATYFFNRTGGCILVGRPERAGSLLFRSVPKREWRVLSLA
jgi:hypothetical protein